MELITIIDKNKRIGTSIAVDDNLNVIHSEQLEPSDWGEY